MDFLYIIRDILFGIFSTVFRLVVDCIEKTIDTGLKPDWHAVFWRTAFYAFLLGSPFCSASIAEARGRNRLIHFLGGLFIPWIYPIIIFFKLPKVFVSEKSDEKERKDANAFREEEKASEVTPPQDFIPESHFKEPTEAASNSSFLQPPAGSIGQEYFSKIKSDEKGRSLGPYNLSLKDGRTIEISQIVNAMPDVVVVEISDGPDKKRTLRFPYAKIDSCIPIGVKMADAILGSKDRTMTFADAASKKQSGTVRLELLEPGTIVGNCTIANVIGCGGMGIVYLAKHNVLDVNVAIKIFSGNIFQLRTGEEMSAERFLREAKLAVRLKHPNAVTVMDAGVDKARNLYYIILEYIDGGTVGQLIRKHGPQSEENALNIVLSVAAALDAAFKQNIIHRDIKPDNIMLTSEGVVKLADLGLGKEIEHKIEKNITSGETALGSPAYISPEQAKDFKNADIRSDIYSLGATLFHILTAEPPFIGDSALNVVLKVLNDPVPDPRTINPSISEAMATLCMRMMSKDPALRPQTPAQLISEIEAIRDKINK